MNYCQTADEINEALFKNKHEVEVIYRKKNDSDRQDLTIRENKSNCLPKRWHYPFFYI